MFICLILIVFKLLSVQHHSIILIADKKSQKIERWQDDDQRADTNDDKNVPVKKKLESGRENNRLLAWN